MKSVNIQQGNNVFRKIKLVKFQAENYGPPAPILLPTPMLTVKMKQQNQRNFLCVLCKYMYRGGLSASS